MNVINDTLNVNDTYVALTGITGTFAGVNDGDTLVAANGIEYQINYVNAGADVQITNLGAPALETSVTVTGGQIVITDELNGAISDDNLTITQDATHIYISDASLALDADTANGVERVDATTVRILNTVETAGITFNGQGGTDTVTVGSDLTLDGALVLTAEM